uniref:Uncharacterized protein n=1 Tax=Parascaris univalens TaxID=6257 RepID=A0A915B7C6_PARUN
MNCCDRSNKETNKYICRSCISSRFYVYTHNDKLLRALSSVFLSL